MLWLTLEKSGSSRRSKPALSIHFWITWSALGMGLMVVPAVLGNALFAKNVLPSYFGQQGLFVGQVTESLPYIFTIASIFLISLF